MEIKVVRAKTHTVEECLKQGPSYLVIGPGPGAPHQAELSKELIKTCAGSFPILGICLGHQALAELYGGRVAHAKKPMHGKTSAIYHSNEGIFSNIPQGFLATRYHSLVVKKEMFPDSLAITATTEEGEIMESAIKSFR